MAVPFTKEAQAVIDRLKAINYDEPVWNEKKVIKAIREQYEILGVELPEIEIARDGIVGFQLARGAARDAAWGAAWGAARDAAWDAARDAAWGAAWGAARDAAYLNTGSKDAAVLKFVQISEKDLIALENGLGYYFPMQGKLILVPMPRMIMVGETLHHDQGMAVQWGNGMGFYFLRGVRFDGELYKKIVDQTMTAEETLLIPNSEQRMAAISMLKPEYLLKQMKARLIDTGQKGTRLYEVKNFMDTGRTEFCMLMNDSSTDRQFIEWTPPEVGKQANAELCQANAFGIPLEDWLLITEEA